MPTQDTRVGARTSARRHAGPACAHHHAPPTSHLTHPTHRPAGGWQAEAAEAFRTRMCDRDQPFPCIFGVDATRRGQLRYAFVPAGPDRAAVLAEALREFVGVAPSLGERTSLVSFFEPDPRHRTLTDYREHFWELMRELSELDDTPPPPGISPDPDDPMWEFTFAGTALFVVANTPAHEARRSRAFDYFTITFQPRFVFDGLEVDSPRGQRARKIIRGRLAAYDAVPQTPLLGDFGNPANREWRQYFLDDSNDLADEECPLHRPSGRASADERIAP